jgi:hypothetical protein
VVISVVLVNEWALALDPAATRLGRYHRFLLRLSVHLFLDGEWIYLGKFLFTPQYRVSPKAHSKTGSGRENEPIYTPNAAVAAVQGEF